MSLSGIVCKMQPNTIKYVILIHFPVMHICGLNYVLMLQWLIVVELVAQSSENNYCFSIRSLHMNVHTVP